MCMIDEKKVRLMTRMALYEENEGKEDLKVSAYYRKDYASLHTLYSVIWATVGYACLVFLIGVSVFDAMMEAMSMGLLVMIALAVLAGYFLVVTVYAVYSYTLYNRKHQEARRRVKGYNHSLVRLLRIYKKETN